MGIIIITAVVSGGLIRIIVINYIEVPAYRTVTEAIYNRLHRMPLTFQVTRKSRISEYQYDTISFHKITFNFFLTFPVRQSFTKCRPDLMLSIYDVVMFRIQIV